MASRRHFVLILGAHAVAWPSASLGEQAAKRLPLVAFVGLDSADDPSLLEAFRERLHQHGYEEGVRVRLTAPSLGDHYEQLREALGELVRSKVDLIVTRGSTATNYARSMTETIPIVMVAGIDPVKAGFAVSLAHPGGNVTGVALGSQDLAGKRLEIVRDVVPGLARVGLLVNPESRSSMASAKEAEAAARALRLELYTAEVRTSAEFEPAFADLVKAGVGAVFPTPSTMFAAHLGQIAQIARRHRLPTISSVARYVDAGGLMAYGTDQADACRRAADYVARILQGARPGDLPIEQPITLEFVVNLKTAKALGVQVPQSVLLRATRVIQ